MALDSILSTPVMPPPPKSSVSSSSSSSSSGSNASSGVSNTSDSSSQQSSSSRSSDGNGSDTSHTTRSSGKNAASRSNSSSGSQAQSASKSSQSQKSGAANQAQSSNNAANGKNGAAQSAKNPGPSFLQTLAQSQADAQDSAAATATTTASPLTLTGKAKGKSAKDDNSAANSAASFGFLSQSLVAAMAGIQQQPAAQSAADSSDSVDDVSLSSGTSAQSLVANLMQNTADELKAAADEGAKSDAASANTTPGADASAAAASNFQSHLGVSSQSATQASQQAADTQINTPVGANGFADDVGDKITWMAHQGVQSASLQMTPEHMGPVEVKISVQDGSATVSINAAHADTRAALEQALPRLREMFSTQGMNLTDASVSQQFTREQPQKRGVGAIGSVGSVSDEGTSAVVSVTSARLGLVDTYA